MTSEFRVWLASLAVENNKTTDDLASMWKKYCKDCQNFDQSPTPFEFAQWNNLKVAYQYE